MSTRSFEIPTIDITPYVSNGYDPDRRRVADAVDAACTRVGFMQIVGHGIPRGVLSGLGAVSYTHLRAHET